VASGEDVMENLTLLSRSLVDILGRMDRGEGLLGELTTESATGREIRQSAIDALHSLEGTAAALQHGQGVLPRLINDRALAQRLGATLDHLDAAAASFSTGNGALPALLNDPAERAQLADTLARIDGASHDLEQLAHRLANGQGLVPKLVEDQEYGRQISERLTQVVDNLDTLSDRLVEGRGTVARLINDPRIYDAINDVIVGVDQSWMLRWLIRNRQKAGIKKRYQDATAGGGAAATPDGAPPNAPPDAPPDALRAPAPSRETTSTPPPPNPPAAQPPPRR
jgi:hypothetical protein